MRLKQYHMMTALLSPVLQLYMQYRALKGKEKRNRLSERYGRGYRHPRAAGKMIWIHAVSVGEVVAARQLAERLQSQFPDSTILMSTNTLTAATLIEADTDFLHVFQPLDTQKWVNNFLDYWRPDLAIFMESDFWPHLISCTAERKIPLIFASAQLSEKAFSNWVKQPELAAEIFAKPIHIFCVDDEQKKRFEHLSHSASAQARKPEITVSGSLKIAPEELQINAEFVSHIQAAAKGRMIIAACSTHENEEIQILERCAPLLRDNKAFLIVAPRHPQRGPTLSQQLNCPSKRSASDLPSADENIYLCDSLGEMDSIYKAADIIVLGGSFVNKGGHNLLEPARALKPVLTGQYDEKNKADKQALSKAGIVQTLQTLDPLGDILKQFERNFTADQPLISQQAKTATQLYLKTCYMRAEKITTIIAENLI